jgi:cellulose 1,4-beta-cellobiosidase
MLTSVLFAVAFSLGIGRQIPELHPKLHWQTCISKGSCSRVSGEVVLDSNWRSVHDAHGQDCYDREVWNWTICPTTAACTENCFIEGTEYEHTNGVTSNGTAVTLKFVTRSASSTNIGSRLFLLKDTQTYQLFKLANREFSFSVDVSRLPCGLNGALYFVEMEADGGKAKYANAKPGAEYGLGYCDSKCPNTLRFINGEANFPGPIPMSSNSEYDAHGIFGLCCMEVDVWEANSQAAVFTAHPCPQAGQTHYTTTYLGICDEQGCDFNSWRLGDKTFLGPGLTVDTKKPFTVVTQFWGSPVTEIRRKYVQNGRVIENSKSRIDGIDATNSISDKFCDQQRKVFNGWDRFAQFGGLGKIGSAFDSGMVLVLSIWDDRERKMIWLDSVYPSNRDRSLPGVERGPCPTTSGNPSDVRNNSPDATVTFGNLKYGELDSTY